VAKNVKPTTNNFVNEHKYKFQNPTSYMRIYKEANLAKRMPLTTNRCRHIQYDTFPKKTNLTENTAHSPELLRCYIPKGIQCMDSTWLSEYKLLDNVEPKLNIWCEMERVHAELLGQAENDYRTLQIHA
jgi:hypothetical protein